MKNKIFIDEKEYTLIIEQKKVKNINIRIKENSVIYVSAPYKVSYKRIEEVILKNKNWIIKHTYDKEELIPDENKVLYLGKYYNIKIEESSTDKIAIKKEDILIFSKDISNDSINYLLNKWYYSEAYELLFKEVEDLSKKINLYPTKIYIGNQKSIWGSCNSKKHIRLNWRLILMPKAVRDYIIIHELCHITYMNHSSDFWSLVSKYDSEYKNNKLWLKSEGKKIMNIF